MFEEVWSQLARSDCVKRPARLHGLIRRQVRDDVYPVIIKADAYVLKSDFHHMVADREWDPDWFAREALPIFMCDRRRFR